MVQHPTILLVDSDLKRTVPIARTLQRNEFRVFPVNSPEDALKLCRSKHFAVDLVITRLVLTPMSGFDFAEIIEEEKLPIKVLLISHYGQDLLHSLPQFARFADRFISSQASDEEILDRVQQALLLR